jgi:hypothetical protein
MLESDISEQSKRISDLVSEKNHFTQEMTTYQQKILSQCSQISALLTQIENIQEKLKATEHSKQKLETAIDDLENKLRNSQFKVLDLERLLYQSQENYILLKNDFEEIVNQKNSEIQRLELKVLNFQKDIEKKDINLLNSVEFIALVPLQIPNTKLTEKTISISCKGGIKVFEFDKVLKNTLFDYLKACTSKESSTVICCGFKNVIKTLEKCEDLVAPCTWTCIEFYKERNSHLNPIAENITKSDYYNLNIKQIFKTDLKLYSNSNIRKRKCSYTHNLKGKNCTINIIDISDDTKYILQDIISLFINKKNDSIYRKVVPNVNSKIKILYSIPDKDTLNTLNFTVEVRSETCNFKNKDILDENAKEKSVNLMLDLNKYKKQVLALKQQLLAHEQESFKNQNKIKLRENQLCEQIAKLKKYTDGLKTFIKSPKDLSSHINHFKTLGNSLNSSTFNIIEPFKNRLELAKSSPQYRNKSFSFSQFDLENLSPKFGGRR